MRGCDRSLLALALWSLLCGPALSSQADVRRRHPEALLDPADPEPEQKAAEPSSQEWSERALEDFLARMTAPEADGDRRASRLLSAGVHLERSVEPPNNLPPRERKAGCKNFYWKGFTSC
ncbi:somatostatin 1.2 [Corythoichthys intestinalis]|uniref:somatostatin 1.2 n=1 Tax=Corythoichthys intestinalis TaxID=161448 RepID=UPI0025A65727|nr:somatostatin 1.2 [Corythoichthys intestinalis]XP_061811906.1 somatostatin-2-like [Nerophis lumbriciformis]